MLEGLKTRFVHFFAKIFAEKTATVAVTEVAKAGKKVTPSQGLAFLSILSDFLGRPLSEGSKEMYKKAFNVNEDDKPKEE